MISSLELTAIQLMLTLWNILISASTPIASTTMTPTMSSISMSCAETPNALCVSLPTLSIYLRSSCQPLLPHTVATTLNAISDDINAITLHKICDGLLKTIKSHEMTHQEVEDHLSKQIKGLRDKIAEYQKTYNQEPEGYIENMCFPNLKLPIGAGFYLLYQQSGSNVLTQATSHVSQPMTDLVTCPILFPSTHPHSHQMTHQLG
jgi:hypothetical protein